MTSLKLRSIVAIIAVLQLSTLVVGLQMPKASFLGHQRSTLPASNAASILAQSRDDNHHGIEGGEASLATSTFNLAKSIIGAGVLSLPSGVAAFSSDPSALVPSAIICTLFGLAAAYSFSSIGKVCQETRSRSFQEAWSKTVSPRSAWTIPASITALCFLVSLAYSIIIGDSFTSLAKTFNIAPHLATRNNVIIALTASVLFPMVIQKNLSALAPFSLLGLAGTLFTGLFMALRYFDGSYAPGGKFFDSLPFPPVFTHKGYTLNQMTFVLISMLSTSYIAHFNAPKFFYELKNPSMKRFNTVVGGAFGASIAFFVFVMVIGFATFGGNTLGFVLNNYSSADNLATIARIAIGMALLTSYPFTFSALREGIFDILNVSAEKRQSNFLPFTAAMLGVITTLALFLNNVGFVVSISGALFGSLLMLVVPAAMQISLIKQNPHVGGKLELFANYGLMVTGVVMAVLGVYVSVLEQLGLI